MEKGAGAGKHSGPGSQHVQKPRSGREQGIQEPKGGECEGGTGGQVDLQMEPMDFILRVMENHGRA